MIKNNDGDDDDDGHDDDDDGDDDDDDDDDAADELGIKRCSTFFCHRSRVLLRHLALGLQNVLFVCSRGDVAAFFFE